jgi:hypothetical protein
MQLIDNWRQQINKLWSARLTIIGILIASGDQILTSMNGSGLLTPKEYGLMMTIILVARLVKQAPPAQ